MTGVERLVVRLLADATDYNRVFNAAETRILTFASAAAAATLEAGKAAVRMAADYQDATIAFQVMLGSAERGTKMMTDLTRLAIATPFKTEELVTAAQRLAAYGVSAENMLPVMKALGEVTAGSGSGAARLDRLSLAFGQVMTAGRLMGTELRQFAEAGVGIEHFAKAMGVGTREFRSLVEAGEVGSEVVVRAFNQMTGEGGKFAGMMSKMSETARGQFHSMKESFGVILRDIGIEALEGLKESGLLSTIRESFDSMKDSGGVRTFFTDLFRFIKTGFISVLELGKQLKDVFESMKPSLTAIGDLLGGVKVTVEDIFALFVSIPGYVMDGFRGLRISVYTIVIGLTILIDHIQEAVFSLNEAAFKALNMVTFGGIPEMKFDRGAGLGAAIREGLTELVWEDVRAMGAGERAAKEFRDRLREAGKHAKDVKDVLEEIGAIKIAANPLSPELMKFLESVKSDFKSGGRPFDLFGEKMMAITAARWASSWGIPIELTTEQANFGAAKIFKDLQSSLKDRLEVRLPTAAARGSAEAQDIINKSQMKVATLQEQILTVLEAAKKAQEETAKEAGEIRKALEKFDFNALIKKKV